MAELFAQALEAHVDEDYEDAIALFKQAIAENPKPEYYDKLAVTYLLLKNYTEALNSESEAIKLNPSKPEFHARKGLALFELSKFEEALSCFQMAKKHASQGGKLSAKLAKATELHVRKCEAEIEALEEDEESDSSSDGGRLQVEQVNSPDVENDANSEEEEPDVNPNRNKYRHEYYQSPSHVTMSVFAKNCEPSAVSVDFQPRSLTINIQPDYSRRFNLFSDIVPSDCVLKVLKSKIEMKLCKETEGMQWSDLERQMLANGGGIKSAYSSKKNWNQIAKVLEQQEDAEKPEGDDALNKLFKQIYSRSSDETRKAMNKSFQTSGGTVLSTNWDEVEPANYEKERTAPDGMEWKNWEGDKLKEKKKDYDKQFRDRADKRKGPTIKY